VPETRSERSALMRASPPRAMYTLERIWLIVCAEAGAAHRTNTKNSAQAE